MRRAFTVIELIVALLIGSILGVIVWSVFWADQRRFYTDQGRIGGVRGALLFDESLARDLHRLALFVGTTRSDRYHTGDPVELQDGGRTLTFMAATDPVGVGTPGLFGTELVTYSFDVATSSVARFTPGNTEVFASLAATDLVFSLVPLKAGPALLGPQDAWPVYNAEEPLWILKYHLTTRAVDLPEKAMPNAVENATVTLVGAVPLLYQRQRLQHPYWMPTRSELPDVPRAEAP